jgi:hypothetical protein
MFSISYRAFAMRTSFRNFPKNLLKLGSLQFNINATTRLPENFSLKKKKTTSSKVEYHFSRPNYVSTKQVNLRLLTCLVCCSYFFFLPHCHMMDFIYAKSLTEKNMISLPSHQAYVLRACVCMDYLCMDLAHKYSCVSYVSHHQFFCLFVCLCFYIFLLNK